MGLISWFQNLRHRKRRRKELAAIDHLRRTLESEKKRIQPIEAMVEEIEIALQKNKFADAEKVIPSLAQAIKEKKVLDQLENIDFKKFENTIFKDLKERLKGIRKEKRAAWTTKSLNKPRK